MSGAPSSKAARLSSTWRAPRTSLVAAGEAAAPPHRGNGERGVLLVEDEANLLAMTAEVLTRLGYEPASFLR